MYASLLTILFLLFAILAWRNLKFALILLSGLLPIYLLRFEVGPIPSTALEFLILICAIIFFTKLIVPSPQSPTPTIGGHAEPGPASPEALRLIENRKWLSPIILLIASACFGVLVAPDTFSALGIWKAYFIEPILIGLIMLTIFNKKNWSQCLQAISISAIFLSIFAIFQYLTGIGIPVPWDIELRATSVFDYPNALGLFLAPIVAFNIILLIQKDLLLLPIARGRSEAVPLSFQRRGWGWSSLFSVILGLIAIILSQTESALVAIPVAVMVTLLISNISKPKKFIILIAFTFITAVALIIPTTHEKLLLQDYSGQVRLSQWSETVELLKDHPFFGAGLNGYPTVLAPYHDSTLYEIFQYPHNIFLNIWVELGVLGLISFCWFIWLITCSLSPTPTTGGQAEPGPASPEVPSLIDPRISLALFASLLTMFIHGLVDVPYFKNDLAILTWILLFAFISFTNQEITKKYERKEK